MSTCDTLRKLRRACCKTIPARDCNPLLYLSCLDGAEVAGGKAAPLQPLHNTRHLLVGADADAEQYMRHLPRRVPVKTPKSRPKSRHQRLIGVLLTSWHVCCANTDRTTVICPTAAQVAYLYLNSVIGMAVSASAVSMKSRNAPLACARRRRVGQLQTPATVISIAAFWSTCQL